MTVRTITTPGGERVVMLAEDDYEALLAAAEDGADRAAVSEFRRKLEVGQEELVPSEIVDRILGGENRVRVWRTYRGVTVKLLASRAGIAAAYLSQIESGQRAGSVETYRKLAEALSLTVDDLVG